MNDSGDQIDKTLGDGYNRAQTLHFTSACAGTKQHTPKSRHPDGSELMERDLSSAWLAGGKAGQAGLNGAPPVHQPFFDRARRMKWQPQEFDGDRSESTESHVACGPQGGLQRD